MFWMTERARLQKAYRKAAVLEARYDTSFNQLVNEQVQNLISKKFDIKFIDQFIKDTEKYHFRTFIMDEKTKKMYMALKDQEYLNNVGEQGQENLDVLSGETQETLYDVANEAVITSDESNIIEYNIPQQNQRNEGLGRGIEMKPLHQRSSLKLKPIYAKIAIALSVVLVLIFLGEVTAERCPGCGKKWSGSVSEYCFGCRAKQAQAKSYTQNHSGSSYSLSVNCRYSNCGYPCVDGGNYCSRHICSVDGCLKVATGNTMFKYCASHEKSLTCAENGCCRDRQGDTMYCNIHNAHR